MKAHNFKELQAVRTLNNDIYWVCWCKHCNVCFQSNERKKHYCIDK